jgi:hypothetical protein
LLGIDGILLGAESPRRDGDFGRREFLSLSNGIIAERAPEKAPFFV